MSETLTGSGLTEAPLTIHFKGEILPMLVKDTCLRNFFETGASNGTCSRRQRAFWENKLFSYAYENSVDSDRVKYHSDKLIE